VSKLLTAIELILSGFNKRFRNYPVKTDFTTNRVYKNLKNSRTAQGEFYD